MEGALETQHITRLIFKPQPFEQAVSAFTAARNKECLSALHHHTSLESAILRTRALLRLRRIDEAEGAIRTARALCKRPEDLAQYYMLLATVLDRKDDFEGAGDAFLSARAMVYSIPSVALHAELSYYEVHSAWRGHHLEQAEQIALDALNEIPKSYDVPQAFPREVWNALLCEALSAIQSVRDQYHSQASFLKIGLEELSWLPAPHVWVEAGLLNNLSSLVSEQRISGIAHIMRSRAEALTWTPELAEWAYNVYRALGWNEALEGNYIGAFSDIREAHNLAPTLPWRVEAILDRAYLFGEIGENVAAHERFNEADHLCRQIDWARSSEERRVLLWAAEIGARLNPSRAAALITQYKAIRRPIDPALVASKNSRRRRAHEHDAYGAVAAANGLPGIALTHFRTALATWGAADFKWRAAKSAAAIARITNRTEDIAGARRRAEPFAGSWLAEIKEVDVLGVAG